MNARTRSAANAIDEYLQALQEPDRTTLSKLRGLIREVVPDAEEVISYSIPAFRLGGMVAGFAATPSHCALYLFSGQVTEALEEQLAGHDVSKGTVRFPADRPLPAKLVRALVRARVAEISGKQRAKPKKQKEKG